MKFSTITNYDKERLLRFNNFIILKKRLFWAIMIVCTVLVSSIFAYYLALNIFDSTITLCFVLVVFIDLTYIFCYLILPRFTIKKSPGLNAIIHFEFQENTFKISGISKNGTDCSELNYSAIQKVMESKHDIYLFISIRQAYIIDKSGFELGSPDVFLEFLKSKNIPYKR